MKKFYLTNSGSEKLPKRMLVLEPAEYEVLMGILIVARFDTEMRSHLEKKDLKILDRLYAQI